MRRTRVHLGVVFAVVLGLLLAPAARAQDSDVVPPQLQSLTISPTSVDVSAGPQDVAVDLEITDNLSGFRNGRVEFQSPRSTTSYTFVTNTGSGNAYRAVVTIPRYAASGVWRLRLTLWDRVGNRAYLDATYLEGRSLPSTIQVSSTPEDTAPPAATRITFVPSSVDVSNGPQQVLVQVEVSDALSGVDDDAPSSRLGLRGPIGQEWTRYYPALSSGTPQSGVLETTFTIPQYSDAGAWRISFMGLQDVAGNYRYLSGTALNQPGLDTVLTVLSTSSDRTAPELTGFTFQPTVINTSLGPQTVRVTVGARDDLAGAHFGQDQGQYAWAITNFQAPSGQQYQRAWEHIFTLVDGNAQSGTWQANVQFPRYSEAGTWQVDLLNLHDTTSNFRHYATADLRAMGFPTDLVVLRPSLQGDGSLGPTGGTVRDTTFGARASVTAPPRVLTQTTTVAIDVFESPLQIPLPQGFDAAGTLYVNVQLTPEPSYPLPAPGLTLVLPLPSPRPAGLELALYRIDPATGQLVPSLDGAGQPIVGHVNADGLAATFTGVVHFSTVVGLLPDAITVAIDVKPGDGTNPINLGAKGVTPVAVLSSATFDALTVDPLTVRLAEAAALRGGPEDVNADGRLDLVVQVPTEALRLAPTATQVVLEGRTYSGYRVRGTDSIRIVPQ